MHVSRKTVHNIIVGLAMALPLVYLSGSMVAGLAGAHGEQIFAKEEKVYTQEDYDYLMQPENFSYGAFDWYLPDIEMYRYGFSFGSYLHKIYVDDYFYAYSLGVKVRSFGESDNAGLGFAEASENYWDDDYISVYIGESVSFDEYMNDNLCFPFYLVPNRNSIQVVYFCLAWGTDFEMYYITPDDEEWLDVANTDITDDDYWYVYFDDGRNLPDYAQPNEYIASLLKPKVKEVEQTASYSDNIFGNFFPSGNFVERMGANSIGESPKGFAPFGSMLRYLDSNVFHAGDSQTALMVYGMVYWSLHVLLADLVYHVLAFVPNLIGKLFDWFSNRGLKDD